MPRNPNVNRRGLAMLLVLVGLMIGTILATQIIWGVGSPIFFLARRITKQIKIGAKVVHRARYVTFQLAEVVVPRGLCRAILEWIRRFVAPSPRAAPI